MRAEFSHEISVGLPVDEALPLFTPKGEESWVPDWRPDYLAPESGEICDEMVFTTDHGGETTLWTCLKWRPEEHRARYFRATPNLQIAFVDVQCRPESAARTIARVSYRYVGLSAEGDRRIASMTPDTFAAMIEEWAVLIEASRIVEPRRLSA
jgi:hypothetical protein